MTGALLSIAAVVPAGTVAAEPDSSQEGAVAPEQGQDLETDSPGFDPGGDTDLPFDTGSPAPSSPQESSPDTAPLESEPADDPDGRLAPLEQDAPDVPASGEDAPVRPLEGVQPTAPPAPGFTIEPPPPSAPPPPAAPPLRPAPQSLGAEPGSAPDRHPGRLVAVVSAETPPEPPPPTPSSAGYSGELGAVDAAPVADPEPATGAAASDDGSRANGDRAPAYGGRVHVVRSGESLWTIAEGLLGPGASAMSIAAEVARLWELNRDRIPSGDPDLIAVGEQLRLR
jgi:hypothetical protein